LPRKQVFHQGNWPRGAREMVGGGATGGFGAIQGCRVCRIREARGGEKKGGKGKKRKCKTEQKHPKKTGYQGKTGGGKAVKCVRGGGCITEVDAREKKEKRGEERLGVII